ncbi:vacuolar protein sorting-associated protein 53 homolog [Oppia nitens]|uniref:vacuolar protein sorting-associated protein 53 homolog n=1 Tax=Oppia nitens TaxID=1686743 RepID=UPI0023DA599C|nr:vacuolar protein sorting-associated protein 53 homolog [Oppia nitens]XP_054154463.1 vacuolar protein sorting-associated protein 53 homolog [Oppia nitens]
MESKTVVLDSDNEVTTDDNKLLLNGQLGVTSAVQSAIEQILSSDDPLDKTDFNAVEYINGLFPSEQSLSNIDDVLNRMKQKIRQLDDEIRVVVRGQTNVEDEGKQALESARNVIAQLANRILEIKQQAKQSEQIVNEITSDIKQLDNAKRNLTTSIIMLNNLHILVEGTDRLQEATKKRQYGQSAQILQGVMDVLKQFERHRHIPHISLLAEQVETIRGQLGQQILEDFRNAFEGPNSRNSFSQNQLQYLAEGCLAVDILDSKIKRELLTRFVDIELSEYKALFQENQEISWLDKIDKRFNWIKKHLVEFEERYGRMFPPKWEVSECIALEFCRITRKELIKVMTNRSQELTVNLLLSSISKSTAFEKLLSQRFTGITLPVKDNSNDIKLNQDNRGNPFAGQITQCFESHLSIYVEAQDKNLSKLIDTFIDEHKKLCQSEATISEIYATSGKLFTQYKNCLVTCVSLSNRQPLVLLSTTFQKYLREYAHRILQSNLPRVGALSSIATLSNTLTNAANTPGGVLSAATSAAGLLQSLLKEAEGGVKVLSKSELCQVCSILLTANYCLETTQQLEKKLQEKVDQTLTDKINMNSEFDIFHGVISNCIQLLIHNIEAGCESAFNLMIKTNWSAVETPIGQSSYITHITSQLQQLFPFIRDNLQEARKYFTQLCNKFALTFIPKYISHLFKCKSLSQGGAEQLLLDTHTLKKVLIELPCWESNVKTAPATYTKSVIKGMTKAEMILKVVLVPHEKTEHFIESYVKLLPDSDNNEFQKILDMKGVKRSESTQLLEAFKNRPQTKDNIHNNNSLSNNEINFDNNYDYESSRIKRLEKLIKKRL